MLKYFSNYNIFSSQQFGFLPGKSTVDALINFLEYQYEALNSKEFSLCIFVDLAKAFDTIDHNILFGKLERYGIRGLPLNLIRSYINDRKYKVKIGNTFSALTTSNIGTAQGSVLAALFFLIYVNDLPKFLKQSHPIIYADDTTICIKNPSLRIALDQCNTELQNLSDWCKANKLTINLNKSYFMLICNRSLPNLEIQIKIDNTIIRQVETHKFLGVTIDRKLKFNYHISEISKKISKSIGIMYKLSAFLPPSTLQNLYYALVHSHLMYCNALWGGTNQTHLQPLVILQKKCLRIIHKTGYLDHTLPLFISSSILQIKDIHRYSLTCFLFKNYNLIENLTPSHNYSTRTNSLVTRFQRLELCKRSIYFRGVNFWNMLDDQTKSIESYNTFKKHLKIAILETYQQTT